MVSNAENLEPLGSWTAFMKQVTQHETKNSVFNYLPAMPLSSGGNIGKWYLDKMNEMVDDLESNFLMQMKQFIAKW